MTFATHIRRITDRLMYNQLYAPSYPAEDRTDMPSEESSIMEMLGQVHSAAAKAEDVGVWLKLGEETTIRAFERFRGGDEDSARKDIETAIEYFRNAVARKRLKADFIGRPDGSIDRAAG